MILIVGARCCFRSLWPPSHPDKTTASHESIKQTQAQRIDTIWDFSTACIKYTATLPGSSLESRRQHTGKKELNSHLAHAH